MTDFTGVARASHQERRFRRFALRCPVHLLFHAGDSVSEVDAISRNLSTGGLLLESPVPLPHNSTISFVITLSGRMLRPLRLTGEGRVTRVERSPAEMDFAIAVECKLPMSEIENYIPLDLH
jgi:PilZ domain-containing protein